MSNFTDGGKLLTRDARKSDVLGGLTAASLEFDVNSDMPARNANPES